MFKAKEELREKARQDFSGALNRIQTPPSEAMLHGREFESLVTDIVKNPLCERPAGKWLAGAGAIAKLINPDGIYNEDFSQVKFNRKITINGTDYLLYGILDWLCGATIYDIKFKESLSGSYDVGHYRDNTQHRMYFELIPDADTFVYLISDGRRVYREEYRRSECRPIKETIGEFEEWLKIYDMWDTYCDKWKCRYS